MGGLVRSLPRPRVPSLPSGKVVRRRLIILAVLIVVLATAYIFWFRNSSLVVVENVKVTGAEQNPDVELALRNSGMGLSTLNLDLAVIEESVAGDPAIRSISASTDFPSGLTIDVDLRRPVGYLKSENAILADDGVVLAEGAERPSGVAPISLKGEGLLAGGFARGDALQVSRVLGAAPAPLLELIEGASLDPNFGVLIEIGGGLELRFGAPGSAATKWLAAAALLADPKFEGAAYIDLTVPDRPVAGGIVDGGVEPIDPAVAAAAVPAPVEVAPAPDPAAAVVPAPLGVAPEAVAPAPVPAPEAATEAGGTTLE